MNVQQLAHLMGVTESDAQGFVDCLGVWTAKGYSVEEAIAQNLGAWQVMMDRVNAGQNSDSSIYRPAAKALECWAVDAFYPAEVAA